jgi:hypothetical protein
MASTLISNIFTKEELEYLLQLPQVLEAKTKLASSHVSYFTIPLSESLKHTIHTKFGIDVSTVNELPMRWITGDSKPHIDVGSRQFEHTYLAYINDNPGEFIIDNTSYPISENTGFMFNEGVNHYTTNTGIMPRLLMGPMNEFALPVGATAVVYYSNYQDAYNQNNSIASSGFILGTNIYPENGIGSYTKWRIAKVGNNDIPAPTGVYENGFDLFVFGFYSYFVYPDRPACFLEGTKILSIVNGEEKYVPIETLRKGDVIKTSKSGNKPIEMIGFSKMTHHAEANRIKDQLYKCSQNEYPDLFEDLIVTGCHSILVDNFASDEQKEETIKINGKIYVTDKKYRLPACVDERASVYELPGTHTIYHLALENDDYYMNYGIYANGLLVETCSKRFIKEISNIILIEK